MLALYLNFSKSLCDFVNAARKDGTVVGPGRGFAAGSTRRPAETAQPIVKGMFKRADAVEIQTDEFLGGQSPFFGDVVECMKLANEGHYHERLNDYFRTGTQRGFRPLATATDEPEDSLRLELRRCSLPKVCKPLARDLARKSIHVGGGCR